MKVIFLSLVSLLLIIGIASAQTIQSGMTLNTTLSNTSITFNVRNITLTSYIINPSNILMFNVSYPQVSSSGDFIGRINITIPRINQSARNTPIDSGGFPYVQKANLTQIEIKSNVTNPVNVTLQNISVKSCSAMTKITYQSANGTFNREYPTSGQYCLNNLFSMNITGVELSSASTVNKLTFDFLDSESGGGDGAGGGGGGTSLTSPFSIAGIPNSDLFLCNATYEYIKKNGQDYAALTKFVSDLNSAYNKNYQWTEARNYVDNWQELCSLATRKSLEQDFVCKKLYNFLIDTEGKYTFSQQLALTNDISKTQIISSDLVGYFAKNYESSCYSYTKQKLPSQVIQAVQQKVVLDEQNCTPYINTFMDYSLNFFSSGTYSCKTVNTWKSLIAYDKVGNNYVAVGLKIWWVGVLLFVVVVIILFNLNGYLKQKRRAVTTLIKT